MAKFKQTNNLSSSNNENIVNEAEVVCQKPQIKHFNSIEEMNEADAKAMADISPLNHLQNATSMIKKIYAEQLKEPMDKTIKFK